MAKFRKRFEMWDAIPVVYDGKLLEEPIDVETPEGTTPSELGDWLITVDGEEYVCKAKDFEVEFELIPEDIQEGYISEELASRAQICLGVNNQPEAWKRFGLFRNDVDNVIISFRLFQQATVKLRSRLDGHIGQSPLDNREVMYHASCFVCAVRRAGRLFELLSKEHAYFPKAVGEVIKLEWKKKRAFFDSFIDPRNAIEHIDGEAKDNSKWTFFAFEENRFSVTDGNSVDIDESALSKLLSARDAISESIIKEHKFNLVGQTKPLPESEQG